MASELDNMKRGFTLIELLVVIALMALLAGLSFPAWKMMAQDTGRSNAINTVAIGVSVARSFSERQSREFSYDWAGTAWDGSGTGTYSGVAAVFTPSGEIRLAENDELALSNDGPLESLPSAGPDAINGYKDIVGIDYIFLPSTAGVAGIYRDRNNGESFLAPPFAIRFDQYGKLQVSDPGTSFSDEKGFVYYNADYITVTSAGQTYNVYTTTPGDAGASREDPDGGSPYDPAAWDNRINGKAHFSPTANKAKLPFEKLEAVIGVIVFDKNVFDGYGGWKDPWGNADLTREEWLKANGKALFFSRYSGTVVREVSP